MFLIREVVLNVERASCLLSGKEPASIGDTGWIPGSGRSLRSKWEPTQYSCLEEPM